MTENLYEINDLTNSSNSLNVTRCGYPIHSTSLQPTPVFTHVNQRFVQSPTTPQNEHSSLLDVAHDEGFWNHTQLETSPSSMLNETINSQVVYPFNVSESLHGLDTFSKTFFAKKNNINSLQEKTSENNQLSEILLSPQRGTPTSGSDRDPFSPVTMHSRPQCYNQLMHYHLDRQNIAYNPYQSQHYGYQHHRPQLRENNLVSVPFNKSQGQYPLQHQENQLPQQHQFTLYSLSQQKQQMPVDLQEGHESAGSPTNGYTQEQKASEHTVFQSHTSQNFLPLSHRSDLYQQQQANEPTHSFSFKQNASFEYPYEASDNMPRFVTQTEEFYMDLSYTHKQEDFCSSHYQHVGSGVNQTAQSPAPRGAVLRHLNSYSPACEQMFSSNIEENQPKHYYRLDLNVINFIKYFTINFRLYVFILAYFFVFDRTESQMADGTKTMLKCIFCHREFKSLPALNGHMRSHGGFRTNPLLKTNDEKINLPEEVSLTDPMVFPVTVPVKDYSVPIKFHNQLKHNDLNASHESPSHVSVNITIIKKIFAEEGAAKREKKRYRHCLVPLVISPCGAGLGSRGPVLFQSQMRSPSSCGDGIPYTPPPMLSPIRPGSGLFISVNAEHPCTGAQTVFQVRLHKDSDKHDSNATLESGNNSSCKPRINIGCNFQAEIPDIQSLSKVPEDVHRANLLWKPCYLDTPAKKQRVDDLLKMACSSVLPGGGTNTEYTLHCLFESCGDVMVKTKSVAQCVEYYYTWKAKLRLGKKLGTVPITPGQAKENRGHLKEANARQPAHKRKTNIGGLKFTELSENISEVPKSGPIFYSHEHNQSNIVELCNSPAEHNRSKSTQHFAPGSVKSSPSNSFTSGDTESNLIFPCSECEKVFLKVKSRNAHMKTHRQPEDPQFWQLDNCPEQENMTESSSPTVGPLPVTHYSVSCSNN
ncbi:Transcriptional-regulating factor 1 [Bagarius yarrelli]|uniref:Transcriptional-regulating factor 1 n=1 Tax=Bagarius yarrelli TaxID=175774 RepID=A0A556U920_BAGYA|nr:Transcriptional-regulating factor 1 [Bagarius yarrelli]